MEMRVLAFKNILEHLPKILETIIAKIEDRSGLDHNEFSDLKYFIEKAKDHNVCCSKQIQDLECLTENLN